jgi:C-terminal processing protease CtpA/Prc
MASLAAAASDYRPVYAGAGLALRHRDGRVVVVAVAAGGAAAQSGLVGEGDELRMVDHVAVDGMGAAAVQAMLVGEEGSVAVVAVAKAGDGGALTHATLVRQSALREREEAARRRKEMCDVGLGLSVSDRREVRVAELVPGGPAAKLGYVDVGDVVVAIDERPIPADISLADLHAFVLSRGAPPAPCPAAAARQSTVAAPCPRCASSHGER